MASHNSKVKIILVFFTLTFSCAPSTISQVSQNLYQEIPEQVQITYYLSSELKSTNPIYNDIVAMLREYEACSHGKIKLAIFDPLRDNKLEETQANEIISFSSTLRDASDQSVVFTGYSGIVIRSLDRTRTLPVVYSTETLEYLLTSNIRRLVNDKPKKIGFLLDQKYSANDEFSKIISFMQYYFNMQELAKGKEVPEEINAIFIIGGCDLSPSELVPIEQYIMRGGRAFFSIDAIAINLKEETAAPVYAPILEMLATYGVVIEPELLMETDAIAIKVQAARSGKTAYNYFFPVLNEFAVKNHPLTADLHGVRFFWASPLSLTPPASVTVQILCSTSRFAVRVSDRFPLKPDEVGMTYTLLSGTKASSPIAATLSGNFPHHFKDRLNAANDNGKPSSFSRLIVVGDADFISPSFADEYNLQFFINSVEWLSNEEDLLSIPAREMKETAEPDQTNTRRFPWE